MDPMDDGRYYRYAAFLPVGLTTAGVLAALAIPEKSPSLFLRGVLAIGSGLAFMGFFALVPYGLFMAIAWHFFRPEGTSAHRRLAILTPLYIAIACSVIVTLFNLSDIGWAEMPVAIALFGAYPLGVGYFYAVLVIAVAESSAAIARRRNRRVNCAGLTEAAP
jgi:hypothetical protein